MAAPSAASPLFKGSIQQASKYVNRLVVIRRAAFMHGPPGVGKSALAQAIADESERPLIDIRLSLYDSSDLKGIPHLAQDGTMRWSIPNELPQAGRLRGRPDGFHRSKLVTMDGEGNATFSATEATIREMDETNAILFLDELNSAPASVQAAAYQLVLDRKIGEYRLPKNVAVLAAGNRASDRGVVHRMPSPLANRFAHVEIEPIFDEWVEWAAGVGIRPEIIGFLSTARQNWNTFEQSKDALAFATPRSWDFVSQALYDGAEKDDAYALTAMFVGTGIATDFIAYRELALKVPDARRIFQGHTVDVEGLKVNILYTLVYNLMYGLRDMVQEYGNQDQRVLDATNNTLIFIANQMPPELAILTARTLSKDFGVRITSKGTPAFDSIFWPKVSKYMVIKK